MNGPDALRGPLCFSGDTLLPTTNISGLKAGDPLFIKHTGVHCGAVANTFNGRSIAATVLMREDGSMVLFTNPAAEGTREPLARCYAWGRQAEPYHCGRPVSMDAVQVIWKCHGVSAIDDSAEAFRYRKADQVSERSYEFRPQLSSCSERWSAELVGRVFGDTSIIAACVSLGWSSRACPVWGIQVCHVISRTGCPALKWSVSKSLCRRQRTANLTHRQWSSREVNHDAGQLIDSSKVHMKRTATPIGTLSITKCLLGVLVLVSLCGWTVCVLDVP